MKLLIASIICLLGVKAVSAMDTGQQIFSDHFKTLSVYNPDDFMAPPLWRIGSNDVLEIKFDLIGDEHEYLRYKLIHCNSDWQPSKLLESEYLDGFNEMEIEDFAYSSNTYIHYINYRIVLPNDELSILHSGNYLLQVYREGNPEDVLIQVRFSVSEDKSPIIGGVTTRTDKGTDSFFQQPYFRIDIANIPEIRNPYQDIIVTIEQNNRPETMHTILAPQRIEGSQIVYEHLPSLVFEAGNEYRRFETVRTDYPGMNVDSVKFVNDIWNAWLQTDHNRANGNYRYDHTQHGRFKIDEYNSTNADLSADYVLTHFTLDPGDKISGEIYIDGDFTNHRFDEFNRMKYDLKDGLYHLSLPLKQGSYNYQYLVESENGRLSLYQIEGNKYETQNEYLVKVFIRTPGSRADRLISSKILTL